MQFPARDFTNQYISASYQDVLQKYIPSDTLYVLDGLGNVLFSIPSSSIGQILITSDVTSSMTVASASYAVTQSYTNILIQSSSFASSSVSASYAFNSTFADSALYSEFSGTSSLAADAISSSYSLSASYAPFAQVYQTNTVSSSWASSSLSSSYSNLALTASYALNGGSGGTTLETGSTYPITSSWSVSASWAPGSGESISASYALTASYALKAGQSGGTTLETGSFYPITSSWSHFALTASYVNIIPSGSTESASYATTSSYSVVAQRVVDSGLSIPPYDYSNIIYNGPQSQFGSCTYKSGGISGSIVAVVTGIYSGNLFIGVSKSLS
jgi:hypothetical protein